MRLLVGFPFLVAHLIQAAPRRDDPLDLSLDRRAAGQKLRFVPRAASTSTVFENYETPLPTSTITVLTFITPSPSADPIPITALSQLVTSYIPQPTDCPPLTGVPPLSASSVNSSRVSNLTTSAPIVTAVISGSPIKRHIPSADYPFYFNFSLPDATAPALLSCTSYIPTLTPICHTTLSPLAASPIPITACDQSVTFSTDHGYTSLPTAAPHANHSDNGTTANRIHTITSYWIAGWEDVLSDYNSGFGDLSTSWSTTSSNFDVLIALVTSTSSLPTTSVGASATPSVVSAGGVGTASGDETTTTTTSSTRTTTMMFTVRATAVTPTA